MFGINDQKDDVIIGIEVKKSTENIIAVNNKIIFNRHQPSIFQT